MTVTPTTLRLVEAMRIDMLRPVDDTAAAISRSWSLAWQTVAAEWEAALLDLCLTAEGGTWPSRRQIARAEKAQRAFEVTRAALAELSKELPVQVTENLPELTGSASIWSQRVTASQFPIQAGSPSTVVASLPDVDTRVVADIIRRTSQQVTKLAYYLSPQATQAMKQELIRGITVGDNPRAAAFKMFDRMRGGFNGGRNRALVIARTEMLDAYRRTAQAQEAANSDVLAGWQWVAQLDRRTCPACWAMHGTRHPSSEAGPLDHQQGRCARVPVTKTWAELGFHGIEEPASSVMDAETQFRLMTPADQTAVMGTSRLALLDSGDVAWADLASRRSTAGWRDSYVPTPVGQLV